MLRAWYSDRVLDLELEDLWFKLHMSCSLPMKAWRSYLNSLLFCFLIFPCQ